MINNAMQNYNNQKYARIFFVFYILLISVLFLYLNNKMPLVGEDLTLQPWDYNEAPVSFLDKIHAISTKVLNSARLWSPRIGEAFATILAAFPKMVFNIINTIFFIWLIFCLFALGHGRFPKSTDYLDLLSFSLIVSIIYIFFPLFGQVFFWKAGVCNHLWGLIVLISFILPFRLNYTNKIHIKSILVLFLFILLGFFAGLTIENASAASIIFLFAYFVYSYRRNSIEGVFILPLVSNAIGLSVLLFSPGTMNRRGYYRELERGLDINGINVYINRLLRVGGDFVNLSWPLLLILFICLLILLVVHQRGNTKVDNKWQKILSKFDVWIYLLSMAFFSVFLLTTISYQSDQRRGFAYFWLMVISLIVYLISHIVKKAPKRSVLILVTIISLIFIAQYVEMSEAYVQFRKESDARLQIIYFELENGQKEIVLPPIITPDSRFLETREVLVDLGERYASYYGFDKVIMQK